MVLTGPSRRTRGEESVTGGDCSRYRHAAMSAPTDAIRAYYQDFSLAVGEQDWREPNGRHEQLRLRLDDVLGGARGLNILDVGCGAGVMSSYLCRYGAVTGTDFSAPA